MNIWNQLKKEFVIAEIGKSWVTKEHEEPLHVLLDRAKKLVLAVKESGGKIIKAQTHTVDDEVLLETQIISPHFNHDRYSWVKRNSYPLIGFWQPLQQYCKELGLLFFSTPMSRGAAKLLTELDTPLWKIGSADISDFVLLDYVRKTKKPIIISSGMHTLDELQQAYNFIYEKNKQIAVLHCVSKYPCSMYDLNLGVIKKYKKIFPKSPIGLSDHSLSLGIWKIAKEHFGATIYEKHFTLNRESFGSDHKVSLEPPEFKQMLTDEVELSSLMLEKIAGDDHKQILPDEMGVRAVFKKKLVTARAMKKGERITVDDIIAVRGIEDGTEANDYEYVIGAKTCVDIPKHGKIQLGDNI